jgi:hypothetical protein
MGPSRNELRKKNCLKKKGKPNELVSTSMDQVHLALKKALFIEKSVSQ